MESLYVPSTTMQKVGAVGKWVMPYVLAGVVTACGFGFRWFASRASSDELATQIGSLKSDAAAIQSTAFSGESIAKDDAKQLAKLWPCIVTLQAELLVYRMYGRAATDPTRRGPLIESAKAFYTREFETQLKEHANDPAEALRIAMLARWSPGIASPP